jgi:hypothetical protein
VNLGTYDFTQKILSHSFFVEFLGFLE